MRVGSPKTEFSKLTKDERTVRQAIIDQCRWMNAHSLNQGTSGNISARHGDRMLITPSSTSYDTMEPEMIAAMPLAGEYGDWEGPIKPSSEWRFHIDILLARPEVGAVVHTHSTYATVLSIGRRTIPACHYMIAAFGGDTVHCADYATFGTKELSVNVLRALANRSACILANHGMIATGKTLGKAMWAAVELETLSKQYFLSLQLGKPVILPADEIERVRIKMQGGYGQGETVAPKTTASKRAKLKA